MKIAAAYIRVSTEDQTELSPDSQIKLIREYAKAHDYILPDEYIYRDNGISGRKTKNRPGFTAMIGEAKVKPKAFDVILVWKYSRFARNREDSIVYKSMLKKQGIDVISISEPTGDDKMSVLIEAMIEAMDEFYSLNLSEEVTRGMLEKMSRGRCVGSAPIGYRFKDGELVIDEEKADIVRRIYSEYLSGRPMRSIAQRLNDDGIRTLYGKTFENRTVEYILRNPLYCGKLRWTPGGGGSRSHYHSDKDVLVQDGIHEPIIPAAEWNIVQEKIEAHKVKYQRYARDTAIKHELMLRGVLRCSTCGATLVNSCGGYQCNQYAHGKCTVSHYIKREKIDAVVVEAVRNADFSSGAHIIPRQPLRMEHRDNTEKLLHREYAKLERIKEAYSAGVDTLEEYKAQKAKITAEIERLKAKQTPKAEDIKPIERLEECRAEFLKLFENPETSQDILNSSLREFVDKVVYDKASETVTIFYFV